MAFVGANAAYLVWVERKGAASRVPVHMLKWFNKKTAALYRDEIVRLGEAYSIASEYTSFLVLPNDAEYQRWKLERKFRTWKAKSAAMATPRTAPQISRVISSIFRWMGRSRNGFIV